jgi:hypothetical protein
VRSPWYKDSRLDACRFLLNQVPKYTLTCKNDQGIYLVMGMFQFFRMGGNRYKKRIDGLIDTAEESAVLPQIQ